MGENPIGLGFDDDLLYERRQAEAMLPRVFHGDTALREAAKTHAARVRLATSSHIDHTPEKADSTRLNEASLAKVLRGATSSHKEAFDVYAGKNAIEVKTIVESGHDRITMHPKSLKTKLLAAKKGGFATHTVVFDTRKGKEAVYYREGLGSFRLNQMQKLPGIEAVREALGIEKSVEGGPGSGPRNDINEKYGGSKKKKGSIKFLGEEPEVDPKDRFRKDDEQSDWRPSGNQYLDDKYSQKESLQEVIHKTGKGYQVRSEKGKNLSSPGLSKGQAKKRLAQVEYFKHQKEGGPGSGPRKGRGAPKEDIHSTSGHNPVEISHQVLGNHEDNLGRKVLGRGKLLVFMQDKAEAVYQNNPKFRKAVNGPDGEKVLHSFMKHWMGTELNISDRKKESLRESRFLEHGGDGTILHPLDSGEYISMHEGGPGSGDHGHEGRPGEVGGSGGGGSVGPPHTPPGLTGPPKKERKKHVIGLRAAPGKGIARVMFGKAFKELEPHEKKQVKAAEKERKARGIIRPEGRKEASAGEEELSNAKILDNHHLGGGIMDTKVLDLEGGLKGVFKISSNRNGKENEVASWRVAKLVGLEDIHPPVVFRTVDGKDGSIMKFWDGRVAMKCHNDRERFDGTKDLCRVAAFDYICGNEDRHQKNWMVSDEGKFQLIDHGYCFTTRDFRVRSVHNDIWREASRRAGDPAGEKDKSNRPSEIAKTYVEHKDEILKTLRDLGLPKQAVDGVRDRIGQLSKAGSWRQVVDGDFPDKTPILSGSSSKAKSESLKTKDLGRARDSNE